MKELKKLFKISLKNLKCRKWLSVKIVIALAVFMFFISLFTVFFVFDKIMYENFPKYRVSANYFLNYNEIVENLPEGAMLTKVKYGYNSERLNKIIESSENLSDYMFSYGSVDLELEGNVYKTENFFNSYNPIARFLHINIYAWDDEFFTENDYAELKLRFGLDSFIIGEIPQKEDEILISAEMLSHYGLSEEDVLGKRITFNYTPTETRIDSATQQTYNEEVEYGKIWEPFKVTGVIRQEYYQLCGHNPNEYYFILDMFLPCICMLPSAEAFNENAGDYYIYSFKNWLTEEQLEKCDYNYYGGDIIIDQKKFITNIQEIVTYLFLIIGVCFGAGALFMIYLMMDKFVRYFARNGGSLLACGISRREFICVSCIQIILLSLAAAIISFVLTTLVYFILSVSLKNLLSGIALSLYAIETINMIIAPGPLFFIVLTIVAAALLLIVALCLILNTYFLTRKKSVKELMNASTN